MEPKPTHLSQRYAAQFAEQAVVQAYRHRLPYPDEAADLVLALAGQREPRVLEVGCGTGDLTLLLTARGAAVDAVDPSGAMLEAARARPGAERVHWIEKHIEKAPLRPPYAVAVAAESLHWADWALALPAIARALSPGARLVLLDRAERVPWEAELGALVARHSTNRDYVRYDLVEELTRRGLFVEEGRRATAPVRYWQTVEDYVESFHSRNGFSRERMSAQAAREFDEGLSLAVQPHLKDDKVPLVGLCELVWGHP
jgi:SAM-dependent methyltransferase